MGRDRTKRASGEHSRARDEELFLRQKIRLAFVARGRLNATQQLMHYNIIHVKEKKTRDETIRIYISVTVD